MIKISIIGTGYVGLVSGTGLAEMGHKVVCADISEDKINMLRSGKIPIYEFGLKELVEKNVKEMRLSFTTDVAAAIREADVVFSAVGTPPDENHKADLRFVKEVAKVFAQNLESYKIFVNKSTVPVGTGEMVKEIISSISGREFDVVSNPEFLREGAAVKDFLNPDRIVIGVESERAKEILRKIYLPLERAQSPIVFTDVKSAELIKYAANSFLATKISFINEISRFCDIVGADVKSVAKGMGLDTRIGSRFLQAGVGYGGSCFPKDVDALIESGKENGYDFRILEQVRVVNKIQRELFMEKLLSKIPDLQSLTVTVWGLSFKPRTDDIRDAPSYDIIKEIIKRGGRVNAFDPVAEENYKKQHPEIVMDYFDNPYDALEGSSALLLLTEWDEFRVPDYKKMKEMMKGRVIIDGRNIFDPKEMREEGFEYVGFGRA